MFATPQTITNGCLLSPFDSGHNRYSGMGYNLFGPNMEARLLHPIGGSRHYGIGSRLPFWCGRTQKHQL